MDIRSEKGSAAANVVIAAAMVVFVLLPVFSAVMEKQILNEKARVIRDAADMANIGTYNALKTENLGRVLVDADRRKALDIFRELLRANLRLDGELCPEEGSIAEGPVVIQSLEMYMDGLPAECPDGTVIDRPAVHSCLKVPVKPSLYRGSILKLLGREYIGLELHVDSEIPVNN